MSGMPIEAATIPGRQATFATCSRQGSPEIDSINPAEAKILPGTRMAPERGSSHSHLPTWSACIASPAYAAPCARTKPAGPDAIPGEEPHIPGPRERRRAHPSAGTSRDLLLEGALDSASARELAAGIVSHLRGTHTSLEVVVAEGTGVGRPQLEILARRLRRLRHRVSLVPPECPRTWDLPARWLRLRPLAQAGA
jgi:hypothetical protein